MDNDLACIEAVALLNEKYYDPGHNNSIQFSFETNTYWQGIKVDDSIELWSSESDGWFYKDAEDSIEFKEKELINAIVVFCEHKFYQYMVSLRHILDKNAIDKIIKTSHAEYDGRSALLAINSIKNTLYTLLDI